MNSLFRSRFLVSPLLALLAYLLLAIRSYMAFEAPSFGDLIVFISGILGIGALILLILDRIVKVREQAILFGLLLLCPLLYYRELYRLAFHHTVLGDWVLHHGEEQFHLILLLHITVIGLIIFFLIRRWPVITTRAFFYLNIFFALLLLTELIQIIRYQPHSVQWNLNKPSELPARSVVYIVPDGMASSFNLQRYWDYSDTGFVNGLRKLGFQIPKHSVSNYNSTLMSVGSALNMNYSTVDNYEKLQSCRVSEMILSIDSSLFPRYLQDQGWKILNYSPFPIAGHSARYEEPFNMNASLWSKTIFYSIGQRMGWTEERKKLYALADINRSLPDSALAAIRNTADPYFCYVHLMLPHYPYFFNSRGEKRSVKDAIYLHGQEERYKEQVQYTQALLMSFITQLRSLPDPPTIVLQSDHGFRSLKALSYAEQVNESLENFTAIWSADSLSLPDTLSQANTFRLLSKTFLLPDRSFNTELDPLRRD